MNRRPAIDPQPFDQLKYQGWTITVVARFPSEVEYTATHRSHSKPREGRQTLDMWRGWASKAKVKSSAHGAGECVATTNVSGRCEIDGHIVVGPVHCYGDKLWCDLHCPATHKTSKGRSAHV